MEVSEISVKKVNRQELLKYLGFRGHEIPSDVDSLIYECIEDIKLFSKPKYIYQIFEIDREKSAKNRDRVFLKATDFVLIGNDINEMLSECDKCVLMAVTLGIVIDNKIRIQQIRDLTKSIILDSCASSAIESVCNEINERIEKKYNAKGLFLTDRFSPGYGDMPISQQPEFLRVLDAQRKIGLNVTNQDSVTDIHLMYINSGANIVYTNTFGANAHKLEGIGYSVEEVVQAGVKAAKNAVEKSGKNLMSH